jgi:N-acetylmuramoyl-L-alanine amidase
MQIISPDTLAVINIWMEARGEPYEGQVAVGEVMLNRLKNGSWGNTLESVILAPYQFSGWNTTSSERIAAFLLDSEDPAYLQCLAAWQEANAQSNFAKGALFYYNPSIVTTPPTWALPDRLTATIGHQQFYL